MLTKIVDPDFELFVESQQSDDMMTLRITSWNKCAGRHDPQTQQHDEGQEDMADVNKATLRPENTQRCGPSGAPMSPRSNPDGATATADGAVDVDISWSKEELLKKRLAKTKPKKSLPHIRLVNRQGLSSVPKDSAVLGTSNSAAGLKDLEPLTITLP